MPQIVKHDSEIHKFLYKQNGTTGTSNFYLKMCLGQLFVSQPGRTIEHETQRGGEQPKQSNFRTNQSGALNHPLHHF